MSTQAKRESVNDVQAGPDVAIPLDCRFRLATSYSYVYCQAVGLFFDGFCFHVHSIAYFDAMADSNTVAIHKEIIAVWNTGNFARNGTLYGYPRWLPEFGAKLPDPFDFRPVC